MEVNRQISINASADKLWKILGADFGNVDVWASRMLESQASDGLSSLGGRIVTTVEYGEAQEILYEFDEAQRQLAYTVQAKGLPPIVKDVTTGWRVEPNGEDQSIVHIQFKANLTDESMSDMIHQQFGMGLEKLFAELKYFAENDQPHPYKQEQSA